MAQCGHELPDLGAYTRDTRAVLPRWAGLTSEAGPEYYRGQHPNAWRERDSGRAVRVLGDAVRRIQECRAEHRSRPACERDRRAAHPDRTRDREPGEHGTEILGGAHGHAVSPGIDPRGRDARAGA